MSATSLLLRPNKAAIGWAILARRNGTVPALPSCSPFPYCTALVRRNGTAPALLSVGPRHMSSNPRRAFLLDRIASPLEAEGIPHTEAINEMLVSELDKIREYRVSLLKRENEKLIREIEKMHSEVRCEMDEAAARRLDLNLERGRIHDELARQHAEITNLITKLE